MRCAVGFRPSIPHTARVAELLQRDGDDLAHCRHCGVLAVGPCARCRSPVCGDCCVLTEGGANVYAICLGCDRRSGRQLAGAWLRVLWWLALPILVLAGVLVLLLLFGP